MTPSNYPILFDENISYRVVKRVLHLFPGSRPANRMNVIGKEDPFLWQTAKANGFSIITFDDDYENLSQWKGWPPKVILLRPGNLTNQEITSMLERNADAIHIFLDDHDPEGWGVLKLFYVNPN